MRVSLSSLSTAVRKLFTVQLNMEENADVKSLFDQCSFAVVRSATLDEKEAARIVQTIELHGGEAVIDQYPETNLDLRGVTHIISTSTDFQDYYAAYTDVMIPVVRPHWIEASLAKDRLTNTKQFSPDPRLFMSDVVVCCADLPQGDEDAIIGGIIAMGGNFTVKITSLVTHIVALSLDNEICEIATKRELDVKIVLPHWFDDCLKLGHKIDEQPYLLPDPEILQISHVNAPTGSLKNKQLSGAIDPHPDNDKLVPSGRRPITSFKGKRFMLSDDLGIGPHLRGILEGLIASSGGKIVGSVDKATYFVCKYRDGRDYKKASRSGIDVGNLAWFYYLVMHDEWTSPTRRLLHYPVPREGIPGFQNKKISMSNYSGEARTYLENLIRATGAECTKTLRQENTHLITGHDQSEKCAAARDWNVHMTNHLWLEESYAKCKILSETIPRYTHFPRRTNLSEVIGRTEIDRDVLNNFLKDDDTDMSDNPESEGPAEKPKVRKEVTTTTTRRRTSSTLQQQAKAQNARAARSKQLQDGDGNGNGNGAADRESLRTPAPKRNTAVGKENVTPLTTGSRKSKKAAAAKLHDMTPDIALYEKEKKRAGGVVYGGRRKGEDKDGKLTRKRSIDAIDSDDTDETDHKKARQGTAPISVHLLISGYKKWYNKAKQEDSDTKLLRELGIAVVMDPSKATHLAVPQILRTAKAVVAFAYAPIIISTDFIDACLDEGACLDPDDFRLKDETNEKKFGVSLELTRERAKKNRHQLLQGRSVYVTEKINGGFETYQAIVEANGGQCMTYRGRRGTMVPSRRAGSESGMDDDPSNEVYLLSGDSKDDRKLWQQFAKMAEGSRKTPRIVRTDWLLDSAMCQKIQPTAGYELLGEP